MNGTDTLRPSLQRELAKRRDAIGDWPILRRNAATLDGLAHATAQRQQRSIAWSAKRH